MLFAAARFRKSFWEACWGHFGFQNDPKMDQFRGFGVLFFMLFLYFESTVRRFLHFSQKSDQNTSSTTLLCEGFPEGRFGSRLGLVLEPFSTILGSFLVPFWHHVSDLVSGYIFKRILVHLGAVLGPSGASKTAKNAER